MERNGVSKMLHERTDYDGNACRMGGNQTNDKKCDTDEVSA